jgi:competence protein ComEA
MRAGETAAAQPRSSRSRARKRPAGASGTISAIELNSADAATLASLPGIGATLAERIVEYRNINGPFASLDELADVGGMTQRRVDAVSPFLTLRGER